LTPRPCAGMGKTTAIREISRLLANSAGKRVVICDTSNEIGGDGDVPHPGIGRARRMQLSDPDTQHKVMIEAVENHMPQVRCHHSPPPAREYPLCADSCPPRGPVSII
jgi:stage III sporulation protein SpoIIIAA